MVVAAHFLKSALLCKGWFRWTNAVEKASDFKKVCVSFLQLTVSMSQHKEHIFQELTSIPLDVLSNFISFLPRSVHYIIEEHQAKEFPTLKHGTEKGQRRNFLGKEIACNVKKPVWFFFPGQCHLIRCVAFSVNNLWTWILAVEIKAYKWSLQTLLSCTLQGGGRAGSCQSSKRNTNWMSMWTRMRKLKFIEGWANWVKEY